MREGDSVKVTGRDLIGVIEEIADGTAYLRMDNGVEMDFPLSKLEPYVEPSAAKRPAEANPISDVVFEQVTDWRINTIARRIHTTMGENFPGSGDWDTDLTNRQRLNLIAALAGQSSADAMVESVLAGKLTTTVIFILMTQGLMQSVLSRSMNSNFEAPDEG